MKLKVPWKVINDHGIGSTGVEAHIHLVRASSWVASLDGGHIINHHDSGRDDSTVCPLLVKFNSSWNKWFVPVAFTMESLLQWLQWLSW